MTSDIFCISFILKLNDRRIHLIGLVLLLAFGVEQTVLSGQKQIIGVSDFVLSGDAVAIGDQCVRLTPPIDWTSGSAWYREAIDLNASFQMEMELMFGCDDQGGADGIVFAFTPYQGLTGNPGEGMGFAGLQPSLGLEIDTWENEHLSDPPDDHIALLQHGYVNHLYNLKGPISIPNVEDCQLHKLHIYWDHTAEKLSVLLDGLEVLSYRDDIVERIFAGESKVFWGVTAATGRYNNQHEICFRKLDFAKPVVTLQFHPRETKLLLRGNVFSLDAAYKSGSVELDADQMSELTKVLHLLNEYPNFELELDGHVHETRNTQTNLNLSLQRAQNIRKYLLDHGIAQDRIHLNAFGDKYPLDPDNPTNKYKNNTRIDIRFYNPRT